MKGHFWDRFKGVFRWRVMLFLSLSLIVMGSFGGTISAVVTPLTWNFLLPTVLYGLVVGWLLGHFRVKDQWFVVSALLLGLLVSLIRAGHLGGPIFQVLKHGLSYLWGTMWGNGSLQLSVFRVAWNQLISQASSVLFGIQQWAAGLRLGVPKDHLSATRFLWGFLIWIFSVWLAWATRRHYRPMWGFVPVVSLMTILLTYIPGKRLYLLAFMLGAGLALMGLGFFERRKAHWDREEVPYYARVEKNISANILVVSIVIVIIASAVPSVSIEAIAEPIQEWSRQRSRDGELMESLGVEFQPGPPIRQRAKFTQLPRSHLIGSGPDLKEKVAMLVTKPGGISDPSDLPEVARYWRAFTYDQYTGLGWRSSKTVEREYAPGEVMNYYFADYNARIVQEIRLSEKIVGPLYAPGMPLSINRQYRAFWRTTAQDPDEQDEDELEYEDLFAVSVGHDFYQVESAVPRVDEGALRQSAERYPDWIEDRYLDLPQQTPFRVREFAVRLVQDDHTNYDKAKTIEGFLRTYEYSLALPAPPQEGDLVDYFLFRLERGYCDYYASSMVVLARAVGIPARLAVGYVDGTYDEEGDRFLVTEADAHSWPELYFTGIGWVPFEPTAQRTVIELEDKDLPVPPELEGSPAPGRRLGDIASDATGVLITTLGLCVLLLLVLIFWYDPRHLRGGTPLDTFRQLVQRLYRLGHWLDLELDRPATPNQFLRSFSRRMTTIGEQTGHERVFTRAVDTIRHLMDWFVDAYYGPPSLGHAEENQIIQIWKRLRWQLLLVLGIFYWQKLKNSLKV